MHETDLWGGLGHGFKAESDQRAEVPADLKKGDTEGREIGWVNRAFLATSSYGNDAAEGGGTLNEGKEIGDEA